MPIVACVICDRPARSRSACPCHGVVRCKSCMKAHLERVEGPKKTFRLPFDMTADMSTLEKKDVQTAFCMRKSSSESLELVVGLTTDPTHSSLVCGKCVDNGNGTFTLSNVDLVVVSRERAIVSKDFLDVCNQGMWDACCTERQGAGVALYCDIVSRMLYTCKFGLQANASDMYIVRTLMCVFASLVADPGASDAYKTRYIELHGGSPSDKVCAVCQKVGDYSECPGCKAGVYICSTACRFSVHFDICNAIFKAPWKTRDCVQAAHLADEINVFTAKPIEIYQDHYCKPVLSRICEVCGAAAKHKCSTCKKVYYCSKACQSLAFPVHKRLHHG